MKHYPLLENKTEKFLFGLYLVAMLFLSRDTLFSSCIVGFQRSQLFLFGLIVLLGLWFLIRNFKDLKSIILDPRMIAFGLSAAILLIPMLLKQDWQLMYFSILLCLLFAVFLTYFTSVKDVAKYYVVILTVLGLYSIFASYCLKMPALEGLITPKVFYNSKDWELFDFGFAYVSTAMHWYRNFGIFREPGVYQFFVLLALYLNNYHVCWNRPWKLWLNNVILVITMITTFAIGGYAELALFAVFLYFDKKYYRETWGKIAGLLAVVAGAGILTWFFFRIQREDFGNSVIYEFYDMFIRLFTKSDSSTDRIDAIVTNIQLFANSPLWGDTIVNALHGTPHNTSSTLLLFAILGFVGGAVNVAAWVALAWKRDRNVFGNLILLLVLFMSFNTQNLVANVFFWLFPMMALVERSALVLKRPDAEG